MAAKKKALPANKIIQWNDLPKDVQQNADATMAEAGRDMPKRYASRAESLKNSTKPSAAKDLASVEAVAPHIKPRNVTRTTAANRRAGLVRDAMDEKASQSGSSNVPDGTGWYFEHHARIAVAAEQAGFDNSDLRAHTASAVMSPQNGPAQERTAVGELMRAHKEGTVAVTPEVTKHLHGKGIDVSGMEGTTQRVSDLPTGTIGQLSDAQFRHHVDTNVDLGKIAKGGMKGNIGTAEGILRGEIDPSTIHQPDGKNGVLQSGKVPSYDHNIRAAIPGSATHIEFVGRVSDAATRRQVGPEQAAGNKHSNWDTPLPLHPELDHVPDNHLLSPKSHTVSDTWDNSMTFDQPHVLVNGKTSVHKSGGSDNTYPVMGMGRGHGDLSDAAVQHAWNNKATQQAAASIGRETGTVFPPVAAQEIPWVRDRRLAGKAGTDDKRTAMTNDEYATEAAVHRKMGLSVPDSVRSLPADAVKKQRQPKYSKVGASRIANFDSALPGM